MCGHAMEVCSLPHQFVIMLCFVRSNTVDFAPLSLPFLQNQFVELRKKVERFVETSLNELDWPTKKSIPELQNQLRSDLTRYGI